MESELACELYLNKAVLKIYRWENHIPDIKRVSQRYIELRLYGAPVSNTDCMPVCFGVDLQIQRIGTY